jgi:predicted ATPase/DNA-binding CsgD family transcriptional regulator/transcriptional regulator with XRE-family HTH domain
MAARPSPTTASTFGTVLRRYRLEAGLTQEELAKRAGLSLRSVSDLERGARQTPRLETVRMLAEGLGFSPADPGWTALLAARNATDATGIAPGRPPLPIPPTPLVGRERDIDLLRALLDTPDVRLVTLTGAGGVGKTRLAIALAHAVTDAFPDGARFVPLASVNHPDLVVSAVAHALGVREEAGVSHQDAVDRVLEHKRLLLVLDNFEHLLPAAPFVADLISRCAGLKVLVTSRATLRLRGEHRFPVPPLDLPDVEPGRHPADVARATAVELFVARARDVWPEFTITDENVEAITGIVQHLDGLPLALELAAARLTVLTPSALHAHLAEQPAILSADHHDAPARHKTMRAAIAWSYDLLPTDAQWLFRRMAVFLGGATVDAIARMTGQDPVTALDGVENLVHHSLLVRSEQLDGPPRFRMLEPIREFALERLVARGEEAPARDAHAAWCLTLGERTFAVLRGSGRSQWFDRIETELGNLRGAFDWLETQDRVEDAVDLAMGLFFFLHTRGYHSEAFALFKGFLSHPRVARRTYTRAKALLGHGILVEMQGAARQGLDQILESVDIFRELNDSVHTGLALVNVAVAYRKVSDFDRAEEANRDVIAIGRGTNDMWLLKAGLHNLAGIFIDRAEVDQAIPLVEETLAMDRALGNVYGIELGLQSLATIYLMREEYERAEELIREALAVLAELGHQADLSYARLLLARVKRARGDYAEATVDLGEALALARRIDEKTSIARALIALGDIARLEGDAAGAMERFREGVALSQQIGGRADTAEGLEGIAGVAVSTRAMDQAARLLGASDALVKAIGASRPAGARSTDYNAHWMAARHAMGVDAFTTAWAAGHALTAAQAVEVALTFTPDNIATPTVADLAVSRLSQRETEVLLHMASGMSNQQIADALFVSHRTVTTHVSSIMAKLNAPSRTAAVVHAIRHRLI